MSLTYGSLFAGYGGLEMGVQSVLGGHAAWFSENEPAPSRILAHHWPDVPNLGDITKVDWATVPPVDVLAGGFPCQDVSHAGKRLGLKPGTRTGLWSHMAYAIATLRPRLVVAENVRGLLSAEAHSDMEPCPWCVGDHPERALRALGAVLGDLAELGYDAWWGGLRAADVGACHGRFRVFLFATPENSSGIGPSGVHRSTDAATVRPFGPDRSADVGLTLLPTPAVNDMGAGKTVEQWDDWTATMQAKHGNGNGHGPSLSVEALRLLPTPVVADSRNSRQSTAPNPRADNDTLSDVSHKQVWREYESAIRRCETAWGRPAPPPTEPGKNGQPRLSPLFVEWMQGLLAGHVTDVPGINRNGQLKALGNGVVPQQAAAATCWWLTHVQERAA